MCASWCFYCVVFEEKLMAKERKMQSNCSVTYLSKVCPLFGEIHIITQ